MSRKIRFCMLILLSPIALFGQLESSNWYFGEYCGLRFQQDTVVPLSDGALAARFSSGTVSDGAGNLLFYTDGNTIWNRNHQPMPNGSGLAGYFTPNGNSNTPCLIVPKPEHNGHFYIFSVTYGSLETYYSEVNMELNSGLGDVTANKNINLNLSFGGYMCAVEHQNGKDIWVISSGDWANKKIHAFLVTENGVQTTPVISLLNNDIVNPFVRVSPSGKKLTFSSYYKQRILLADFDPATGKISTDNEIPVNRAFGIEFSNDNRFLYVSCDSNEAKIVQFDLSYNNIDSIVGSKVVVFYSRRSHVGNLVIKSLQRGIDEKIYFLHNDTISVINAPDKKGLACDVDTGIILFKTPSWPSNFPPLITGYWPYITFSYSHTDSCSLDVYFTVNDISNLASYIWQFGDPASGIDNSCQNCPSPLHTFSSAGMYKVKLLYTLHNGFSDTLERTLVLQGFPAKTFSGIPASLCQGDTAIIQAPLTAEHYLWNTGDTTSSISATVSGIYALQSFQGNCIKTDSINLQFQPKPMVYLGNDSTFCGLVDYALNPQTDGKHFKWNTGDTSKKLYVNKNGTYSLEVKSSAMCDNADTVELYKLEYPVGREVSDTLVCGETALLDALNPGSNYLWSTGETGRTILANKSGNYGIMISNGICTISDTINLRLESACEPYFFIPNSFSPNGDGINDEFIPVTENVTSYRMSVYSRWGEQVFFTDKNAGWNGTFKDTPCPEGVYFYKVSYWYATPLSSGRKNLSGIIHLIK